MPSSPSISIILKILQQIKNFIQPTKLPFSKPTNQITKMSHQNICLVLALAIAGAVLLSFGTPVLASHPRPQPSAAFSRCCRKIPLSPATVKDGKKKDAKFRNK
jgi:hypothetical protein